MPTPKPYRTPWVMPLIIVLIFGLLFGLCWVWYENQLENLNKHLDELKHKTIGAAQEKTRPFSVSTQTMNSMKLIALFLKAPLEERPPLMTTLYERFATTYNA